jgi:hypothetical protein
VPNPYAFLEEHSDPTVKHASIVSGKVGRVAMPPSPKKALARITLTSLFRRELGAIEIIEFFGSRHQTLKTMRTLMRTFSKI